MSIIYRTPFPHLQTFRLWIASRLQEVAVATTLCTTRFPITFDTMSKINIPNLQLDATIRYVSNFIFSLFNEIFFRRNGFRWWWFFFAVDQKNRNRLQKQSNRTLSIRVTINRTPIKYRKGKYISRISRNSFLAVRFIFWEEKKHEKNMKTS